MTPQEKANELFKKFQNIEDTDWQIDNGCGITLNEVKQCVLITIDEILNFADKYKIVYTEYSENQISDFTEFFYWKKVKEEIEKL